MDFGALPPEINSARIYLGPGSAPMLAAAAAWDGLAAELHSTATTYQTVVTGLTSEGWLGPASAAMGAAAAPYMTWMNVTGGQAEQAAAQAQAAAGAFEAAFAMTVPPAEVAANRALLAVLVATNVLGQNTPAIAATEAQYGEMWAQDAAAMYGYAASSSVASTLQPFTQPAETTNLNGLAGQAAAVVQAAGSSASTSSQTMLAQLMTALPNALQQLTSPMSGLSNALGLGGSHLTPAASPTDNLIDTLLSFVDGANGNPIGRFLNSNFFNGLSSAGYVNPAIITPAVTSGLSDINSLVPGASSAVVTPPGGVGVPGLAGAVSPHVSAGLHGFGGVSGQSSRAAFVGRLSVPQSWTAATQVVNHAGAALPGGGWTSTPTAAVAANGTAGVPGFPGMPSAHGHSFGSGPRYGFRPTIMARPPAAG